MTLSPGTRLGHYEILGSLGAGGMGEVYRAADTTLGREVALKVLPASVARDAEHIERFRREARAVAAINHPNIVTIFSVERDAAVHFLTMELVEGQPLDRYVPPRGLPIDTLLDIAVPLADALAAAHDKGIVHRDLKPGNVMITTDGRAKILDFGLAKMSASSPSSGDLETMAQTSAGVVLGTMPYMSPEQIEGRPVDARSDLFSFGVMLHEMAVGARPFQGASQAALASAILRDAPAPPSASRSDVPSGLERLIRRCLEKDRDRRIQTARDVRNELDALRRADAPPAAATRRAESAAADRQSIVVLPFANLSPDAENEYFSDGLTEELIADLSKVRALSVISRTSAMQLKDTKKDVKTIGRELGVRYLLNGSVRKAGNSLRITAQLVDAASDAPLWSDKFSGTMDDVFDVQERVSREIVRALDITLSSDERRRMAERPIADARAFELVLQARQDLRRYDSDRAVHTIREAMRIEGETPPLQALLTQAKVFRARVGVGSVHAALDEAEAEARNLLARMPEAPYGDSLLGQIAYERGRQPEAVHYLKRALDREPNDSDTMLMLCVAYFASGQNAEAGLAARRMIASDPLSPLTWMASGVTNWFVGRAADGIPDLEKAVEIDPLNLIVNWCAGYAYALVGRLPDAIRRAQVILDVAPDVPYTRQLLALIDGLEGRRDGALARITDINVTPLDSHHRFHLAESFIWAGQHERGLDLLEQAVLGFYPAPFIGRYCRFLDPVRDTPRFRAILATAEARVAAFPQRERELSGRA
ncbi:MAG TPA: protein kinase [Vicinamibacterales bacterium]|nr:protein kinase [Vicinamibacterales bacterium]